MSTGATGCTVCASRATGSASAVASLVRTRRPRRLFSAVGRWWGGREGGRRWPVGEQHALGAWRRWRIARRWCRGRSLRASTGIHLLLLLLRGLLRRHILRRDRLGRRRWRCKRRLRVRQQRTCLQLLQLRPPAKCACELEALRGLVVLEPLRAPFAAPRGRGACALAHVGALGLGLVLLDGVMERPHRPQKRHRVQIQLGGESNALPDGSSVRFAHPEASARVVRGVAGDHS
jgi:hypothetical protein